MGQRVAYTFVGTDRFTATGRKIVKANNKIKRSMTGVGVAARRQTKMMGGFKKSLAGLGALTGRGLGMAAVVAGAVSASRAFASLDSAVVSVVNLLDDEATVKKYGGEIENLAKGARSAGFATQDLGLGLFNAVSFLDVGTQSFTAFTEAQDLAIGGTASLGTSVLGITKLMNAYDKSAQGAKDASIGLFVAQQKGGLNIEQFGNSIGKVATISANAGIRSEELLAVFARITKAVSPEETATGIKAMISLLQAPPKQLAPIFKLLRIPTGIKLKEAGLVKTIERLQEIEAARPGLLPELIPNIRAFLIAATLTPEALAEVKETERLIVQDRKDNIRLSSAVRRQKATQSFKTRAAAGEAAVLAAEIGEIASPAVKGVADALGATARELSKPGLGKVGDVGKAFKILGTREQGLPIPKSLRPTAEQSAALSAAQARARQDIFGGAFEGLFGGQAKLDIQVNVNDGEGRVTVTPRLIGKIKGLDIGVNFAESTP